MYCVVLFLHRSKIFVPVSGRSWDLNPAFLIAGIAAAATGIPSYFGWTMVPRCFAHPSLPPLLYS